MTPTGLTSRYDSVASGWTGMLDRLGFTAAYADMVGRAIPDRAAFGPARAGPPARVSMGYVATVGQVRCRAGRGLASQ
jgi:hypothetical protein